MKNILLAFIVALMASTGAIATQLDNKHIAESGQITGDERLFYRFTGLAHHGLGVLEIEHLATGATERIVVDLAKRDGYALQGGGPGGVNTVYQGTTGDFSTYHVEANGVMIGVLTVNNATGESYYTAVQ